jgi:hypothetical protein
MVFVFVLLCTLVWVLTAQARLNLVEARAATLHSPSPLTPSATPPISFHRSPTFSRRESAARDPSLLSEPATAGR